MMSLQMHITGQELPVVLPLVLECTEISDPRRQLGCQLAILESFDAFGGH
jgi:hypothetical protein